MADPSCTLWPVFKWLPYGCCLHYSRCRRATFVPGAVQLLKSYLLLTCSSSSFFTHTHYNTYMITYLVLYMKIHVRFLSNSFLLNDQRDTFELQPVVLTMSACVSFTELLLCDWLIRYLQSYEQAEMLNS